MTRGLFALCLLLPLRLFADGGKVELRQTAGPYVITLFSAPVPLRMGSADLSVMVQNAADQSAILDASVKLLLNGTSIRATTEKATNKLLYAARVDLSKPGTTRVVVAVNGKASVSANLDVLPAQPALIVYWPYFAVVPGAILLYLLNQFLTRSRERTWRRSGRSSR